MDRHRREEHVRKLLRQAEDIVVGDVELRPFLVDAAVLTVSPVEREDPEAPAPRGRTRPLDEAQDILPVGLLGVGDSGGAHVDLELEPLDRVERRPHRGIDAAAGGAGADARNMNVDVDLLLPVDPQEGAVDQRPGFRGKRDRRLIGWFRRTSSQRPGQDAASGERRDGQ
jgi:hypothetical protein